MGVMTSKQLDVKFGNYLEIHMHFGKLDLEKEVERLNTEIRITSKIIWSVLLLVLISRGLLLFTGYIGVNLFSKYTTVPVYQEKNPGSVSQWKLKLPVNMEETKQLDVDGFIKFDSYSYLKIATKGYDNVKMDQPHTAANWVFFPLYPLLIYLTSLVLWLQPGVIGIVLSNVFIFAALIYIYRIALQRGLSEKQTEAVLFLIMIYPSSLVFFCTVYGKLVPVVICSVHLLCDEQAVCIGIPGCQPIHGYGVPGFINLAFAAGSMLN